MPKKNKKKSVTQNQFWTNRHLSILKQNKQIKPGFVTVEPNVTQNASINDQEKQKLNAPGNSNTTTAAMNTNFGKQNSFKPGNSHIAKIYENISSSFNMENPNTFKPGISNSKKQAKKIMYANMNTGKNNTFKFGGMQNTSTNTYNYREGGNQNTNMFQSSNIPGYQMDTEDFTEDFTDLPDDINATSFNTSTLTSPNTFKMNIKPLEKPRVKLSNPFGADEVTEDSNNEGEVDNDNAFKNERNTEPFTSSSNAYQQMKGSSDIKTFVQGKVKNNEPKYMAKTILSVSSAPKKPFTPRSIHAGPSGVPRSFLTRANQKVIEPQTPVPVPPRILHFIPTIQRGTNQPVSHSQVQQPLVQTQCNPQTSVPNVPGTPMTTPIPKIYSPTDLYHDPDDETRHNEEMRQDSTSPDTSKSCEKRVSAFDRLGPVSQPKKPKLTINLSFNMDQSVREVVDETKLKPEKVYTPVHEREDILQSTDEIVMKYLALWPWTKNITKLGSGKSIKPRLRVSKETSANVGHSITAMMMVKEQMDEVYQKDHWFLAVMVTGYPESWTKEDVLDVMLENLKGKSFIPCFIEFNAKECKFLVIRCRQALLAIHTLDFQMQKDGVQLSITISQVTLAIMQLDFLPRLVLRKRLSMLYSNRCVMDLSAFTLKPDISHFIYFPLNRVSNQIELFEMQTENVWSNITELNLSHNRITTLEGLNLQSRMQKLQHLDLSYNYLERATSLLEYRCLPLRSLRLEGNPLCQDYIQPDHYITVMRMMFPLLRVLDGVTIHLSGDLPTPKPNYCPYGTVEIIDNFLQLYFPLIDSHTDDRIALVNMYDEKAVMTITYRPKFGYESGFRYPRNLLIMSRVLLDGSTERVEGSQDIEKLLKRWPRFEHDPASFTVDVIFHNDTSTIVRVDGIVKLPADSLADNDQLVAFSRTIHLCTKNQVEYKIKNEMVYWTEPTAEYAKAAFQRTAVQRKPLSFKFESPPDERSKKRLTETFMKLTRLEQKPSKRCLEMKDWDLREALEYFMKLYKVDNLTPLMKEENIA